MKKNGFTLAEVLITLAIIGVVATMTLPTLMTNTGEQQYKTGLKKAVNILTEAAQMHQAIEGYDYSSIDGKNGMSDITANEQTNEQGDKEAINGVNSFIGLLKDRTKIDYSRTKDALTKDNYKIEVGVGTGTSPVGTDIVYFADGTAIIFDSSKADRDNDIIVVYDTNGVKGPNVLSNCSGKVKGMDDSKEQDSGETNADGEAIMTAVADVSKCDTKTDRVIQDQFMLMLQGTVAQPYGAAATWAFGS